MDVVYAVTILAAMALTWALLRRIDPSLRTWRARLRSRLLLGLPVGTLVTVAIVVLVYLVVQSGYQDIDSPVVIPFQSWSYTYPTGWLTAGLAHSGLGHLLNNVTSVLILGSIAEYAYSHFPQRRGASTFTSQLTNPYVRAFVVVPVALLATAIFSALFAIGPVIGFSGVVFAVAGFALVRYPLTTVLGLFAVSALRRVYDALDAPVVSTGFVESGPSPPWWAEVAIQGHAIGLLLGVLAGIYVFRRRQSMPSPARLWIGVFLFAIAQNLWAVYWFEGTDRWILLRGVGVVLVILLASLVAIAVARTDRDIVASVTRRQVGVAALAIALALLIGPALPLNLTTTDPGEAAERPGLEVDDYRVIYAEDIVNQMVAIGDLDLGGLAEVRTSGVIVYSERRDLWVRAVSTDRLADRSVAEIPLGDVASRTEVTAYRESWGVTGNSSVYRVWLIGEDETALAFESAPSTADVRVANHTVTVTSDGGTFYLVVHHDGAFVDAVEPPEDGESVDIGAVTLERDGAVVYLVHDGTQVPVASS